MTKVATARTRWRACALGIPATQCRTPERHRRDRPRPTRLRALASGDAVRPQDSRCRLRPSTVAASLAHSPHPAALRAVLGCEKRRQLELILLVFYLLAYLFVRPSSSRCYCVSLSLKPTVVSSKYCQRKLYTPLSQKGLRQLPIYARDAPLRLAFDPREDCY